MAKCFLTGIEVNVEDAYVLDNATAYKALKDLRQRAMALDRLIQQLGPLQDTEIYDQKNKKSVVRKDRRLVCRSVAEALSSAYPEKVLFLTLTEYRTKKYAQTEARLSDFAFDSSNDSKNKNALRQEKEVCNDTDS